jgi:serine/threonine protein kinase/tetratricopeptide (TPR) repeat protein
MGDLIGHKISHYTVVDRLGEGGMGEVYLARDERLGRQVAVKVLPDEVAHDPDRLARFEREARAAGTIDHPNILTVHDIDRHEGIPFLVAEALDGESLRELLERGPVPARTAAEYGVQIARGLAAAHDRDIVHRDLKPENLFVTRDGQVKILDFGLAKLLSRPESDGEADGRTLSLTTDAGVVLGTVGYMSPEQVRGDEADARSDIFALGCVLYELLAGSGPFRRDTPADTMSAILRDDPPPMADAGRLVPPAIEAIVLRCLEKRPDDRFSSARDLALALEAVGRATGEREPRRPAPRVYKPMAFIRVILAAALAVALLMVGYKTLLQRSESPEAATGPPRIVVLPFENLGPPEHEYFAAGMTEEITSRLAAVSGLQVISRTSARRYAGTSKGVREIGQELDVGYVVEGTVRWDRDDAGLGRVRITPQLIRVTDDSHLWSERYDRLLQDVFAIQSDIAAQVIDRLQAALLEPERRAIEERPTDNMEAYQAYLLARQYWWTGEDRRSADMMLSLLERAVGLDPEFALAHALLSQAHAQYYHYRYDFTAERQTKARRSAERALELRPDLAEAHLALAFYHYWCHRDYEVALAEVAIAELTRPNDPEVLTIKWAVSRRMGRWQEALATLERALETDPQGYLTVYECGGTLTLLRQYARADEYLRRAIAVAPDRPDAYYYAALNDLLWDGTTERAHLRLLGAPSLNDSRLTYVSLLLAEYDHDVDALLDRIAEHQGDVIALQDVFLPKELLRCKALDRAGGLERARSACESAVSVLTNELDRRPYDHRVSSALGLAYAILGRDKEAVVAGERAAEQWPVSRDAFEGTQPAIELAKVYARVGDHDRAIDQLEYLLSIPCRLSVPLLRLDPAWDPLRGNPKFEELLTRYGER